MLVSAGILNLKPIEVVLPNEVALYLAKIAQQKEMDIGDIYNTFYFSELLARGVFCTGYDNKGYDPNHPDFKLPLTIEWELDKVEESEVIFSPHAKGRDFDNHRLNGGYIWLQRMTECLSKVGFNTRSIKSKSRVVKITQQPWRVEEEPVYCLESEISEIAGTHVKDLLGILGLQLPR